jgi:bifunctional DNA-binding transcriptional regulator/antitoxin component of YhaV-PrlF toxin-antitoxin module
MTLTLDNKPIVVPEIVRRKAAFRRGDRVEFRVSRRAITIVPQAADAGDYPPAERLAINRGIAQSEKEYAAGLGRGPFKTAEEFFASMEADIKKLRTAKRNAKSAR